MGSNLKSSTFAKLARLIKSIIAKVRYKKYSTIFPLCFGGSFPDDILQVASVFPVPPHCLIFLPQQISFVPIGLFRDEKCISCMHILISEEFLADAMASRCFHKLVCGNHFKPFSLPLSDYQVVNTTTRRSGDTIDEDDGSTYRVCAPIGRSRKPTDGDQSETIFHVRTSWSRGFDQSVFIQQFVVLLIHLPDSSRFSTIHNSAFIRLNIKPCR